jgi:hypothetical protein
MTHLLGIDFMYDTPKNRAFVEKIIQECNGQMDCVTDKNAVFAFKDVDSMKKADHELYKIGIISDLVTDNV